MFSIDTVPRRQPHFPCTPDPSEIPPSHWVCIRIRFLASNLCKYVELFITLHGAAL